MVFFKKEKIEKTPSSLHVEDGVFSFKMIKNLIISISYKVKLLTTVAISLLLIIR
ncbi:hypothetical protein bcere0022_41910 [Bacillus cereus Rock3-44]|nr:hypothetical protein bcere0022_41910 [Bacillus cereus Rock3-44]